MKRHALTDSALAELGAGRPGPDTVAALRRAQAGKHLLLLREIARHDPEPWYAAERADPDGFRRRLADPLFGAWAAATARSTPRDQAEAPVRATAGGTPRDQAEAPAADAHRLTAECDGMRIGLRLEDRHPARGLLGLEPAGPLDDSEVAHWRRCLDDGWRLLVERHRPAAGVLASVVSCVVPVRPDPAARGISATSADAFGAVAMSAPGDGTALAVGLLHEAQHSLLNAVTYLFDLLTEPGTLGYSPWRDDPRPASGILHGTYAYLTVTRFWRDEMRVTGDRLAQFEFARWREATATTADGLVAGGLTPAGDRFVRALRDEAYGWATEPTDPDIERLARAANRDHYLRWRLRNLEVDPADAVRAWEGSGRGEQAGKQKEPEGNSGRGKQAGKQKEPEGKSGRERQHGRAGRGKAGAVATRLVPGPKRALESSERLDLIHRAVKGDPPLTPGTRGTAADTAFLRGDHGTAADAYAKRVSAFPDDDAAWAGLALAGHRGDRVELAKAVTLAVGADPREALEWADGREGNG